MCVNFSILFSNADKYVEQFNEYDNIILRRYNDCWKHYGTDRRNEYIKEVQSVDSVVRNTILTNLSPIAAIYTKMSYKGVRLDVIAPFHAGKGLINGSKYIAHNQLTSIAAYYYSIVEGSIATMTPEQKQFALECVIMGFLVYKVNNIMSDGNVYNPITYAEIKQSVTAAINGALIYTRNGKPLERKIKSCNVDIKDELPICITEYTAHNGAKPGYKELLEYWNSTRASMVGGLLTNYMTIKKLRNYVQYYGLSDKVVTNSHYSHKKVAEQPVEVAEQPVEVAEQLVAEPIEKVEQPTPQQHRVVEKIMSLDECYEWATEKETDNHNYNFGPDPTQWTDDELTRFVLGEPSESESESEATTTPLAKDLF